ncbi:MAG: DivIVA domain-containing protein [Propionibacteriaceae bacterium]|jgi:DivIVA domain-containing protein|nr:DivIVA domain-containing protein [Propionibacteriaceae bacterium]
MELALWVLAAVVLGLGAVAASGRFGEMPGTLTDTPKPYIPAGLLDGEDIRATRFNVVARGYSVEQVDELLDRVALQFDQLDQSWHSIGAHTASSAEIAGGTAPQDAAAPPALDVQAGEAAMLEPEKADVDAPVSFSLSPKGEGME